MNGIIVIIVAIILCAFFSGMEIAFVASNKLRIELDRKQGAFGSEILKRANEFIFIKYVAINNITLARIKFLTELVERPSDVNL